MNDIESTAIKLLRYGIGRDEECHIPSSLDVHELYDFSQKQGISAMVLDGMDKCICQGQQLVLNFQSKMKWIGHSQQTEAIYEQHKKAICNLARFYKQYGIRMMLMKGVGLSLDYPVPNHRPCGDIDIYLYGNLELADNLIRKHYGIEIDHDQHKHTIFQYEGVTVENHYDFANYHKHKSSRDLDAWLKEECKKDSIEIWDNVFLPSPSFNAIFLLHHAASHFAAEEITIRHLLDWAFFVEKHYDEVDWEWHWKVCQKHNMHIFLLAVNEICVKYLGFDASKFRMGCHAEITEKMFREILSPAYIERGIKGPYIYVRWRKWWANRWKHRIVYPESLSSTFFHQLYAHLMKPATLHK